MELEKSLFPSWVYPGWLHSDESEYVIAWEDVLKQVFLSHPDWVEMVSRIDVHTLMTDERLDEILRSHKILV